VTAPIATWLVWSPRPPECMEKISCASMLDAARAWAERQFRKGMLAFDGTEVLACCENDAMPRQSTYRLRISLVQAPAFRASFVGLAFEATDGNPAREAKRG
jgi:hypothetical protein